MLQPDKILYEAEVTATGGRDGKAASDDGLVVGVAVAAEIAGRSGRPGPIRSSFLPPAMPRVSSAR